jgi:hypothetical protein
VDALANILFHQKLGVATLQTFLFVLLLFVAVTVSLSNWATAVNAIVTKKSGSVIPLIGGGSGAIAFGIGPSDALRSFWWIPLLVDLGCAWLLFFGVVFVLTRILRKRS